MGWDSLINWAIPLGIILWLAFLFYVKFKEIFDTMFRTFGRWFGGAYGTVSGKTKDIADSSYETVYSYGR